MKACFQLSRTPASAIASSIAVAATLIFGSVVSIAEDAPARRVGLILEGAFESHEIARSAEGATRTLVVPFHEWDYGVRAFTKQSWEDLGMTWEKAQAAGTGIAAKLVESVKPDIVRDERGTIQYIVLVDPDPFLTSVILTQDLFDAYRDSLGDRIFVLPIDRNRIYLFPATGGSLEDYGPSLVDEFRRTPLPVTLEVFLLDRTGYRAVGQISRDPS